MFQPKELKEKSLESQGDEDLQFCWGIRKGTINLYESFTLDGIEYFLYDCVYMWREGQAEPDIAKLVKICEMETHEKKVEVVWFFRPSEIAYWLGDIKPVKREIFLACGHGKGLSNFSPLEAISGKCNVVCSSKHQRNPQPTEEELRMADYIFYRTFDVGKYIISEELPSSIVGIEVDHFFNRRCANPSICSEPRAHSKARTEETPVRTTRNDQPARAEKDDYRSNGPGTSNGRQTNNFMKDRPSTGAKLKRSEHLLSTSPSNISPTKKTKLLASLGPKNNSLPYAPPKVFGKEKRIITKDSSRENKDQSTQKSLGEKVNKFTQKGLCDKQHTSLGIGYNYKEVTRRPSMDSSKWLKLEVWTEERLNEAIEKGTLAVLENLDPSFTSAEVEDIIWLVFEEKVKAKMVQTTSFSSPHTGQALAIFKTKEAADNAILQLNHRCLVLGDGRPIFARRRLGKFGISVKFHGHLCIGRTRAQRQREEMRNAVATSHFSQGNTIEFEMAIQWRALQEKTKLWWTALHEAQGKEIEALMKQMKIRHEE